jgi:hypothetical protein
MAQQEGESQIKAVKIVEATHLIFCTPGIVSIYRILLKTDDYAYGL